MVKMIECQKCKDQKSIFGSIRFIEDGIDAIFCDACRINLAIEIEKSRKNTIINYLQPERSKREDLIEMKVSPEPDKLTKMRLEEDVKFSKKCCGVNPDLLGCGALNIMET